MKLTLEGEVLANDNFESFLAAGVGEEGLTGGIASTAPPILKIYIYMSTLYRFRLLICHNFLFNVFKIVFW